MAQRQINVRVRPPRVIVLIDRNAGQDDLLLTVRFFSRIWGGRFGQILPVDPKACDALTEFRLGRLRPEFVYGVGLDDEHWRRAVAGSCQPRGYGRLHPEFVRNIRGHYPEEYYLVDHALVHLNRERERQPSRGRALRLVSVARESPFADYCAAVFGTHHENLRREFFDDEVTFSGGTTTSFVALATEFVEASQRSWLDVTGHGLSPRYEGTAPLEPTVVLVGSAVQDLALFWNLRTASDSDHPAWALPIPVTGSSDPAVLEELKKWLLAFLPYGPKPNYCLVTSESVPEQACSVFAQGFAKALSGTAIERVDYEPPENKLPLVIPYEYETVWPVDVTGRRLTTLPPKPKVFEELGSPKSWIVDLLRDVRTGRAVEELQLPSSPAVLELLNGPCPPNYEMSVLPRTGDGPECITLRCSGSKEVVSVFLPTAEEILGEILREHGAEPVRDEKRSSYAPVIRRFGGLAHAASAFSGKSGDVLKALVNDTKTLAEIQSACRLGAGDLAGDGFAEQVELMCVRSSERMKRVARRRFAEYALRSSPESRKLRALLEYWADRKVVSRRWKVGPCQRCSQYEFVESLDIRKRVTCANCGHRISLPASVPIGYTLPRPVSLAIREGIVPVTLTGWFLRRMTRRGFFWLPGVKYECGGRKGDIDVLACCDGLLVFCECKCLEQTADESGAWDRVVDQFLETAAVARACKAGLVVLASQVAEYPREVRERIARELGDSIGHLLLDRSDLERGTRDVGDGVARRPLAMGDFIRDPFPERQQSKGGKPRSINFGWAMFSRG